MGRRHTAFRIALVNGVLLVVGLLAVEVIFGSWFDATGMGALRVPRNIRLVHELDSDRGQAPSIYHRDRFGFRGQYASPSQIGILAIGGSTTNELYVGDGHTWTDTLAANFRRAGRPLSEVNAGVDGHSTVGHLESFERWFSLVSGLQARYILVYAGINDIHLELSDNARYDRLRSDDDDGRSGWNNLRRRLRDSSALYAAYRSLLGAVRAKKAGLIYQEIDWSRVTWVEHPQPSSIPVPPGALEGLRNEFGERMAMIIDRIRALGSEPIIVSQHRAGYRRAGSRILVAKGERWYGDLGEYFVQTAFNLRALEICRAKEAICIDLAGEIEFEVGDFFDYVHTSARGSRRIGDYLFARLEGVVR